MTNQIIDFHTHYLPDSYVKALQKNFDGAPDGWPTPNWTPETTLDYMKENGIAYSVLSLSSPHINFGDKRETLALAADINAVGEQLQDAHPDKLGYLATLPLPYVDESIATINKAFDQHAIGVTLPTNTRGLYLGDPLLDPVYEALNDNHAIVSLHPNEPSALPTNVDLGLPTPLMGFFFDTTMTFMNLLKYNFFTRYPDIRLIIPHAGAFLGILTDRVAGFVKKNYDEDIYDVIKNCYFDTAGHVLPRQLPALMSLADESHILFGSDIPYTPLATSAKLGQSLIDTPLLTAQKKKAILTTNAKSLLKR